MVLAAGGIGSGRQITEVRPVAAVMADLIRETDHTLEKLRRLR